LAIDAYRCAQPFSLDEELVESCLSQSPHDEQFRRAVRDGLTAIPRHERQGALAGITGHVAESVAELLLDQYGYCILWHFPGPGRHGVDLLALHPSGECLMAIEVKGTLRPRYWPRLTRRGLAQMSADWVDKADNPGMSNWDLRSADVYGAVFLLNFADRAYKVALSHDFRTLWPVTDFEQLSGLRWLVQRGSGHAKSSVAR
jgi:hypothetical protein